MTLTLSELITPCWGDGVTGGPSVPNFPIHGAAEIMNPMSEFTYDFLEELYTEITEDFPDEYVHLGMDEVYYACWLVSHRRFVSTQTARKFNLDQISTTIYVNGKSV